MKSKSIGVYVGAAAAAVAMLGGVSSYSRQMSTGAVLLAIGASMAGGLIGVAWARFVRAHRDYRGARAAVPAARKAAWADFWTLVRAASIVAVLVFLAIMGARA